MLLIITNFKRFNQFLLSFKSRPERKPPKPLLSKFKTALLDLLYKFLKYTCWYFKYREQFTWPKLKLLDHFLFSLQMAFKILLLFEISCRKQTVFFHSFLCKFFKNFLKTFWYSSLLIIKLRFFAVHFLLKFKTKDLSSMSISLLSLFNPTTLFLYWGTKSYLLIFMFL